MTDIKSKISFDTPRRKFYEEAIINHFKLQHIATESIETVSRALEGKRQEVESESYLYLRERFIDVVFYDLEQRVFNNFDHSPKNPYTGETKPFFLGDLYIFLYKDLSTQDVAAMYINVKPDVLTYNFLHKYELFESAIVKEYVYILGVLADGIKEGYLKARNSLLDYRNFLLQFGIVTKNIDYLLKKEKLIKYTALDLEYNVISPESEKNPQEIKTEEIPKQFKELAYSQSSTKNGSQTTRKLNNVLKLLYYMAEDKYGHEKGRAKETATKLETLSGNSKQTIEKWLEDASFLIEDEKN